MANTNPFARRSMSHVLAVACGLMALTAVAVALGAPGTTPVAPTGNTADDDASASPDDHARPHLEFQPDHDRLSR